MKINYKIVLPVIILVILAIVAKKQGWIDSNSSAIEVTTGYIYKRTVVESVTASGKIQPEVEVKMSPEVSGEIIRVLDKGIIIRLEMEVEGIIPFGKMSKKDRRALANQYEVGANLSGIVMKVSPEDKKVVLYKEELAGTGNRTSANDEVKQYLTNQKMDSGEKLELPQELLDIASQAE